MATIKDIAKHADVSAATVSRVINDSGYVSAQTRKVVEEAIQELNYVPNRHAQNLRRGDTRNLGIITSSLEESVLARIEPFMEFANEVGYTTTLFNTYNSPKRELEALDRLKSKELDGVFIIYRVNDWATIESYLQYGPIVTLHNIENNEIDIASVFIDHYSGYKMLLDYLWDQGERSFINLFALSSGHNTDRRLQAYFDFCKEHAITPHPIEPYLNISGRKRIQKAIDLIDDMDQKPDAILAHSDQVASFIVSHYRRLGTKMPQEIAVVGFDNLVISELMNFTSVDYAIKEQGRNACRILMNQLETDQHELVPLEFKLIKRDTTK